jgi:hypothetical protein
VKKIITLLVLSYTCFSYSQSKPFEISGNLFAQENKIPLESATIHLERIKDSSLVTYTISDKNGGFVLQGKTPDSTLKLYISYIGYKTHVQSVAISKQKIDLKAIYLETDANILDEIVLKSRAPVTIKKDTLEFNVKSFKTKKDANVEDLLKALPGVEVDAEGKITVNGKSVSQILVNGQPFFGNDQTIVTKNLTKDIIETVQVTDTKTKSEAFTDEVGSANSKTINLTIKKENSKSVFGRLAAGGGTDQRYELAGMASIFNDTQRLSFLAGGNNINSPGFSFGDINRMARGGGGRGIVIGGFGRNSGITTSRNAGVNYVDKFGKATDLSSSYFYSSSNSENVTKSSRENFLPDSRYFSESNSSNINETSNHRVNLEFDVKIDSTLLINIQPVLSANIGQTEIGSSSKSLDADKILTNESTSNSFVETTGKSFSNDLTVTKLLKRKGSYLKFSLGNDLNTNESDNFFNSKINIYGNSPSEENRNQFIDSESNLNQLDYSIRYREPLVKDKLFLDTYFIYNKRKSKSIRSTFDSNTNGEDFTEFNEDLSTDFEYTEKSKMPVVELMYRKDKLYFTVNGGYKFRTLENKDKLRPQLSLKKRFEQFEQTIRFRYTFNPSKSFNINYYSSNRAPQISQLQPFEDVSNPLNIVQGNPELKPSNSYNLNMGYRNFNMQKKFGIFMNLNGSINDNNIVQKSTIDEDLVRRSTYVNVNGNRSLSGNANYSKRVKIDSLKSAGLMVGVNGRLAKSVSFNNDVLYAANIKSIAPNFGVNFNWRDVMVLFSQYSISFSNTKYTLDNFENQRFMTHNLILFMSNTFFKKLTWENNVNFNYNPDVAPEFQKSGWFWNSTINYAIAKDKGLISLKAYDVLNQNTNARRVSTQNYIQDSQSTILRQYFMLGFSWKFNSLKK